MCKRQVISAFIFVLAIASSAHATRIDAPIDACTTAATYAAEKEIQQQGRNGKLDAVEIETYDFVEGEGPYYITWISNGVNGHCFEYLKVLTQRNRKQNCTVRSVEEITIETRSCY